LLGDSWEWDGKSWTRYRGEGPPPRVLAVAAYDKKNKQIVLYGGFGSAGLLTDTWLYDDNGWKKSSATAPGDYVPHAMFYNEVKQKIAMVVVVLNSGDDQRFSVNEMWEWSGSEWVKSQTQIRPTSSQSLQAIASFRKGEIVIFDGDNIVRGNATTWQLSGNKWTDSSNPGPAPRVGDAMIFDPSGNQLILFGGSDRKTFFNDTWKWDGSRWQKISVQ
jgi:hypothetical protein